MPYIQRWKSEHCPFAIDYPAELIGELKKRSIDALLAIPNGGLEIGGVLFGRVFPNARSPLRIELVAERPIECSHSTGPAFRLSDEEIAAVQSLLERNRLDPEVGPLSVLGFWISRTRGDFRLSDDDVAVYEKLFPNAWQIVLILAPKLGSPAKGSFFFRFGRVFREPAAVFELDSRVDVPPPEPKSIGLEKSATAIASVKLALSILISFFAGIGVGYLLFHR